MKIPKIGKRILDFIYRLKRVLKAFLFKEPLFSDFGFEYIGPVNGHDIRELRHIFHNAKNFSKPAVIHVLTQKGKGYSHAEDNPSLFHGVGSFSIIDGKLERKVSRTFTDCFAETLLKYHQVEYALYTSF